MRNNKEEESLDAFEDEGKREDIEYVPLIFIAPPPPLSQKESNRPTDIGKGIESLNYLICIPKNGSLYNCSLSIRVPR